MHLRLDTQPQATANFSRRMKLIYKKQKTCLALDVLRWRLVNRKLFSDIFVYFFKLINKWNVKHVTLFNSLHTLR